jgi:cell division protein FtsL
MALAAPRARPSASPGAPTRPRAQPARARRDRRDRTQAARDRSAPRLGRSVVWIVVVAGLLAGIVALQVAVLELRMERGRVQAEIVELRAQNAKIESAISAAASVARVEGAARGRLGLVPPVETTYLELPRGG